MPLRLALLALLLATSPAAARTLYWESLEVEARLLADGRLRVLERQLMVFTGDWNGGERVFRVLPGQELRLHGMRRIDPGSGDSTVMRAGGLNRVDNYDWHARHTLRWRSRLPSDPEFDRTAILYELDYTLIGVVQEHGGVYWIGHDFAFPDRAGRIEEFRLKLEVDDPWSALPIPGAERSRGPGSELIMLTRSGLVPGERVLVDFGLVRTDGSSAAAVRRLLPRGVRLAIAAVLAGIAALLLWRFLAHERGQGRYDAPSVPRRPDRAWLEENVLKLRPEVVGAVWDGRIGSAEVAAVLARLVAERRLASSVRTEGRWFKRQILELELLVDRSAFSDYERRLIDRLFFSGRSKTDTAAVRERYRSTGFSPAATISSGINKLLRKLPGLGRRLPKPSPAVTLLLVVAGVACLTLEALFRGFAAAGPIAALIVVVFVPTVVVSYAAARAYARRADRLWIPGAVLLVALAACVAVSGHAILAGGSFLSGLDYAGFFGRLALALLPLALVNSVLNAARTRDREAAVRLRRQLAGVRRSLARELHRNDPRLEDDWLPYLLALGLQKKVDRWFRAFGGAPQASSARAFTGSTSSSAGRASSWSGGGGVFGGAGASSSWTAAAGSLAAGVARPSSGGSSGGGSSGGGGGGSSGGGGGGGW